MGIWFQVTLVICLAAFGLAQKPSTGCGAVVTTTKTGKSCLAWKDATKKGYPISKFPYLKGNVCANPSGKGGPWCFVANTKKKGEFERCDCPNLVLPKEELAAYKFKIGKIGCPLDANGKYVAKKLYNYNGKMDRSASGYKCMNWSEIPFRASGTDFRFIEKNYARTVGTEKKMRFEELLGQMRIQMGSRQSSTLLRHEEQHTRL